MIEVRIDLPVFRRIEHNVTHFIELCRMLRTQAGIPLEGVLISQGVTRGTMIWTREEDLDEESWVIRWYDTDEDPSLDKSALTIAASGKESTCTWVRYKNVNTPDEDDEL